jgi:hypothetical protein
MWAVQEEFLLHGLILEYGTDTFSRNVGAELPFYAGKIPKECRYHLRRCGSLKSLIVVCYQDVYPNMEYFSPRSCNI